MVSIEITQANFDRMRGDLVDDVERVGFFLAEFGANDGVVKVDTWRLIPPEGFTVQTDFHVALTDEMKVEIIQWAWEAGRPLVEVHSHLASDRAAFSGSDLWGFDEWVPHLRWRLDGMPYAAMVWDETTFDGLAWIDSAQEPEQVDRLQIVGARSIPATGRTLARLRTRSARSRSHP